MKKFAITLCIILTLLMVLPLCVSADDFFKTVTENPPVTMPFSTPTIDGTISPDEGWSNPADFNDTTAGNFWAHNVMTTYGKLYFAYNNDGIFFAGDFDEHDQVTALDQNGHLRDYNGNKFVASSGEDDIDIADGPSNYGWDGDIFIFAIDTLGNFRNNNFLENSDYTAWYCVGLFQDGSAKVYRTKVNRGELTTGVKAAGKEKADSLGWTIECFIPWDTIVDDANALANGAFTVTKDDMTATGATSLGTIIYHDRWYDFEAGYNDTWGRYITCATTTALGVPGQLSSGDCISAYGLTLINDENPSGKKDDESDAESTPNSDAVSDSDSGAVSDATTTASSNNNKNSATTTKSANTGKKSSNGSSSAQTFDAGIAVAVGALAVSGIGAYFSKKSKKS